MVIFIGVDLFGFTEFTKYLECVGLCLSSNLGNLQTFFFEKRVSERESEQENIYMKTQKKGHMWTQHRKTVLTRNQTLLKT